MSNDSVLKKNKKEREGLKFKSKYNENYITIDYKSTKKY